MLRVTRGAPPASAQEIQDQLARLEAKIDAIAELMANAMIEEDHGDDDFFGGERDPNKPL
jgi:alkylation response protein AidB-like acyl-CoA dehydrogenase